MCPEEADINGTPEITNESTFSVAPVKGQISIDDLEKLDIRAGTIVRADEVAKSDKMVRLTVDFGDRTRTIFSGMKKERKDIHEIEGMQALFVVNLKPRNIMGELSEGMILDIGYSDGLVPALAVSERRMPDGARVG